MTQFVFKNIGQMSIKNIHATCNRSECLSFGFTSSENDNESKDQIYETSVDLKQKHEAIDGSMLSKLNPSGVMKVPLPEDTLFPGAEVFIPVWIHGINQPGVHELDFLFYYEPVETVHKLPYRVVHQTVRIQTLSTMNVTATMRKGQSLPSYQECDDAETTER